LQVWAVDLPAQHRYLVATVISASHPQLDRSASPINERIAA
jgi:hypothetical protein